MANLVLTAPTNPGTSNWVDISTLLDVNPEQTITVAKDGGQFTTIEEGLNAAGLVATTSNRIVVIIYPGNYTESNPLTVPDYVAIFCPGAHETTRMYCSDPNANGLVLGIDTEVFGLQVRDASGVGSAGFFFSATCHDAELHDCKYNNCYIGFHSVAPLPNPACFIRQPHCSGGTCTVAYQCSAGGRLFVEGAVQTGAVTCGTFAVVDGANSKMFMDVASIGGTNTTRVATVSNNGQLQMQVCTFENCAEGFFVEATGGILQLGSVQLVNVVGDNINLADAAGAMCIMTGCYFNDDNFVIGASATLQGNYESSGSRPGPTAIGELWLGVHEDEQVPLSTYIRDTASSGWVSGGAVTVNAGRVLDVALGLGIINTGTGVEQVSWLAGQVTAPASSTFWVYANSSGVLAAAMAKPSEETNITLAQGWSDANNIILLTSHTVDIGHVIVSRHEYTYTVIKQIWVSGLTTTLPGLLKLDVSSGTFYRAEQLTTAIGAAPITFATWYNDGNWVPTTGQTDVDNAQYNNYGVGLAAIPGGQWVKHALYVNVGGAGTQFHLVYGQTTFANQPAAEAGVEALPPDFFGVGCMVLSGIVIQQGAAAVAVATNRRPQIVTAGPGSGAAPADHGLLAGLPDDDHQQYLLLNGGAVRNAVTGTIEASGGTLIVPTAAVPAQTAEGSVVWDSNNDLLTVGDGVARKTMVDTNSIQTLSNKILSAPTIADATNIVNASTIATGVIELATQVEVDAGVDALKAVTPATLTGWIGGGGAGITAYAEFQGQFGSGTAGGAAVAGWQTRTLNTTVNLAGAAISRVGNGITLAAGTYAVWATAPAYRVGGHKLRFRNTTAGVSTLLGTSSNAPNNANSPQTLSNISGLLTVGGPTNFELQHYCVLARAVDGLGVAAGSGEAEVYGTVLILRLL